ncbi:MAG: hypothetical protein RL708_1347, partial [Bacteroidota bacterium]|jgi:hypothetical protein
MKQTLFIIALFATSLFANATVRTVNNNFVSPGQYASVTAAIAAASAGDTILIHASPVNYNSFTITKQLVFFGTGHNPQTNNAQRCYMQSVILSTNSSGTQFYGLDCDYIYPTTSNIANIIVSRCKINGNIQANNQQINNWTIEGNYFATSATNIHLFNQVCHDLFIKNNIFNGTLVQFYTSNYNVYFINNIFLRNGDVFDYYFSNANFYNNIFYRGSPSGNGGFGGLNFDHNVSYQCTTNTFPNGTNYVNTNPLFTNFPSAGDYFSYAYDFHLQTSSTVHNGGNDGTDPGVYGGTVVFNQNGLPSIPYIKSLTITGANTVPANGTLNISVKGKVTQ